MQSSPDKTSRHMDIIEKNIKKTLQNRLKESIINEYLEVVQEDLVGHQEDFLLNLIQENEQENIERNILRNNYATLSENVELNRQKIESLKDNIDYLSIHSIAEKETFRRQQNDEDNKIKSMYQSEIEKVNQQLEEVNNQCNEIEQELRKQISLENATKNARIFEMKNKLQRQIIDRRNDIVRVITEGNAIKQELDNLKSKMEQDRYKNNYKNTMYFHNINVDPQTALKNPANIPKSNNYSQDKLDYTTNKQQLFPIPRGYSSMDKQYQQIEDRQVLEKEIPPNHNLLEKLNNEQTFGNIVANQQKKDIPNPVSHASNLKPNTISYAANTNTNVQQSFSKETAKEDDVISIDEIDCISNSSAVTPSLQLSRRVPKVYSGTTKKRKFHKLGK